ncbi:P-loop containing nucleoside triphosphate hydrolase protein [Mycena leptocephala]|nr:P-loop containing nucleoside triphosphate hydrolase protein [Mycena leptocephala]
MPLFTSGSGFQITGGTFIDNAGDINIHTTQIVQGPTTGALEFWAEGPSHGLLGEERSGQYIGAARVRPYNGESSSPSLLNPTLPFSPQEPLTDQFGEPADVRSDTSSVPTISRLPWDDPAHISIAQAAQKTNNCPPPSRIFQGRQTIRDEMNQFFNQDIRKQHIYLLYGLGGAGKTQIMLKFISDSSCFTDKFFLDASTMETINTGLKEIAVAKNAGNSAQDALKWLVNNHEKWLLFFDNADDPTIKLNTFLPKCNHGNIVITSRNPGLHVYAGSHSLVTDMEEADAVPLLLRSAALEISPKNEKIAAEIVKELCYLPLAIVQAGAFISQSSALDSYLDLYMQNRAQLLNTKPTQTHDDYDWTVYTTWQMSFDKLSQPAAMFLQLCSFLHRDRISEEIFSRAARYRFPFSGPPKEELEKPIQFLSQFLDLAGQWNSLCFLKVTNEIMAYSLVTFDPARKVFSIHPLVHTWSQTTIPDQQSYHSIMGAIVGMSIGDIPSHHRQLLAQFT